MKAAGAVLLLTALALDVAACAAYAGVVGTTNDLFPRWVGTRLWLQHGVSPYSPLVDQGVRAVLPEMPGREEDPFVFGFVYPAYVALLLAPLAVLPFQLAATVWLLLIQGCCLFGALACWRATELERTLPPLRPWPALALTAIFPASVMNLVFLQFSAIVFAGVAGAWWLVARGSPASGGALLALGAVKPALAVTPGVALVLGSTGRARWFLAIGCMLALTLIAGGSLIAMPRWPLEFWRSTVDYARGARPVSAGTLAGLTFSSVLGGGNLFAGFASVAFSVIVVGLIVMAWRNSTRTAGESLQAGVLAGAWLVPPLYEWNNILLLALLIPALRPALRLSRFASAWAIGALAILGALTAVGYARWPSETRLLWPSLALAVYCVARLGRAGTKNVTDRSGGKPSEPIAT